MTSRSFIVDLVLASCVLIPSTGHGLPIRQDLTISLASPDPMTRVEFTSFQLIPAPESDLTSVNIQYDFMLPGLSSRSAYERIFQFDTDHGTPMDPMFMSAAGFSNGFIAKADQPSPFPSDPMLQSPQIGIATCSADFELLTLTRPIYAFDMPTLGAARSR